MGETKQLLPWQGKTVLGHVLDTVLASSVGEVILVLGHEAERVLEKLSIRGVKVVFNPEYRKGMSTSLRLGLRAVNPKSEGFLVFLADQPSITAEIIDRLVEGFARCRPEKSIIVPSFRGRRGHPVLFDKKHREEFWGFSGEVGGREILARHPEEILLLEMDTDAVLLDLDTPEDYRTRSG